MFHVSTHYSNGVGTGVEDWCGRRDLNPGSLAWKANVLNQTRRQPHFTLRVFPLSKLNLSLLQPSKARFADLSLNA
jgi:hypothetical protein